MFAVRHTHGNRPTAGSGRKGAALIETAVALPLLSVLVFSSIEVANIVYLRQSLNIAAYEAAISATKPGATMTVATTRCGEVLTSRGITEFTLDFTPSVDETTVGGTEVQVDVTAPAYSLSIGPLWLFKDATVRARVKMARL
jgi:Flp pilus assembly protein TadG